MGWYEAWSDAAIDAGYGPDDYEDARTPEEVQADWDRRDEEWRAWREEMTTWQVKPEGVVLRRDRTQPGMMGGRQGAYQDWWYLVAVDEAAKTAEVVRPGERRSIRFRSKTQARAAAEALERRRIEYLVWVGRANRPLVRPPHWWPAGFTGPAPDPEPGDEVGLR